MDQLVNTNPSLVTPGDILPAVIAAEGADAAERFLEFLAAQIRNPNTRAAYIRSLSRFLDWCDEQQLELNQIRPIHVAAYIELLGQTRSRPTVKQALAAIRTCFDYMVVGHIMATNPALNVKGPRHVVNKGTTPVLQGSDARAFLESINVGTDEKPSLAGLRDRAIIGTMIYSFARISAVLGLAVGDYYRSGSVSYLDLDEKGGKRHRVPCHHNVIAYIDAWLLHSGIGDDAGHPLFPAFRPGAREPSPHALNRRKAWEMIKRRARRSGLPLPPGLCNHSFRATGITEYLKNGGQLEYAQHIASHSSPTTTRLYDRRDDEMSLDEIERIVL